jgi:hypothetical protein
MADNKLEQIFTLHIGSEESEKEIVARAGVETFYLIRIIIEQLCL